ncbi:MAG: twin-arginine translocase subunit TatC [Thiotrichales bacterium]
MTDSSKSNEPASEMGFIAHLVELRDRVLRMFFAVLIVFFVLAPFANKIYTLLAGPLLRHLPEGSSMIAIDVASPFLAPFKLAFILAIVLAVPYLLYQVWSFVAPGLYKHEQKLVSPLIISSAALFYVGMAFAYFIVMPVVFGFLTSTAPEGVAMMTDINRYLDFVLVLFLAFGVAFEVPVATYLVVLSGLVSVDDLAKSRRYVIVGAFVIGAIFTPPDVFSQIMLAIPIWLLFELGLIIARRFIEDKRKPEADGSALVPVAAATSSAAGAASHDDVEPFKPLSEEELLAELDRAEADEAALTRGTSGDDATANAATEPASPAPATNNEPATTAAETAGPPREVPPPSEPPFDNPNLRTIRPPRPSED